jgi:hypothetical protein
MGRNVSRVFVAALLALLGGCEDGAKPLLDECERAEAREDWTWAVRACRRATVSGFDSKSAKAAAAKLPSLRAKLAAKEAADAEAKEKAEAANTVAPPTAPAAR